MYQWYFLINTLAIPSINTYDTSLTVEASRCYRKTRCGVSCQLNDAVSPGERLAYTAANDIEIGGRRRWDWLLIYIGWVKMKELSSERHFCVKWTRVSVWYFLTIKSFNLLKHLTGTSLREPNLNGTFWVRWYLYIGVHTNRKLW